MSENPPVKPIEKLLTYSTTGPYEVLNSNTPKTKRVWVVFHGIGFLSRYFLRYFNHLDPVENYIVAPQAPSLYYLDAQYRNVGASWLTREQTERNMANLLNYLDALYMEESLDEAPHLTLMGYSQGVSVLCRWVARRKIPCDRLMLYAGRVPSELQAADFEHLDNHTPVEVYAGSNDPFISRQSRPEIQHQLEQLFGPRLQMTNYPGGHELKKEYIRN
jgi:predicted esterase